MCVDVAAGQLSRDRCKNGTCTDHLKAFSCACSPWYGLTSFPVDAKCEASSSLVAFNAFESAPRGAQSFSDVSPLAEWGFSSGEASGCSFGGDYGVDSFGYMRIADPGKLCGVKFASRKLPSTGARFVSVDVYLPRVEWTSADVVKVVLKVDGKDMVLLDTRLVNKPSLRFFPSFVVLPKCGSGVRSAQTMCSPRLLRVKCIHAQTERVDGACLTPCFCAFNLLHSGKDLDVDAAALKLKEGGWATVGTNRLQTYTNLEVVLSAKISDAKAQFVLFDNLMLQTNLAPAPDQHCRCTPCQHGGTCSVPVYRALYGPSRAKPASRSVWRALLMP